MEGADARPAEWPPELLPGADEFLAAFWELCSDRQIGMQAGPIPFSAIDRWASRSGYDDPDEFISLVSCIRVMDREWLGQAVAPAPAAAGSTVSSRPMTMALFDALF